MLSNPEHDIPMYRPRFKVKRNDRPKPRSFHPEGPIKAWTSQLWTSDSMKADIVIYAQHVPTSYRIGHQIFTLTGSNLNGILQFQLTGELS